MSQRTALTLLKELTSQLVQAGTSEAAVGVVGEWLVDSLKPSCVAIFGMDAEVERWRLFWHSGLAAPDPTAQFAGSDWPLNTTPWQGLRPADCVQIASFLIQPIDYGSHQLGMIWLGFCSAKTTDLAQTGEAGWSKTDLLDGAGSILGCKWTCLEQGRRTRQELDRLQVRSNQLVVLNRIGQALAATLDPGELCRIAHREIGQLFDCPNLGISTYDPEHQLISPLYLIGDGVHIDSSHIPPIPLEPETGIQSKVIVSKQPLLIPDMEALSGEIKTYHRIETEDRRLARAAAIVPMVAGDRVIGTLQIQSYSPGIYTQENLEVLGAVANQLGVALENGQLYASAQRHLRNLEAIQQMYRTLQGAVDLDSTVSVLLDETLALIGTDAGSVLLYEPEKDLLVEKVARGWYTQLPMHQIRPNTGVFGKVFSSGDPLISKEFQQEPDVSEASRPHLPSGWSGMAIPLFADQRVLGVLNVAVKSPRVLTPEESNLVMVLGRIAGSALDRAALYGKIETQARRLQRVVDSVSEGLVLLAQDFSVVLANPAAWVYLEQLAGHPVDMGDVVTDLGGEAIARILSHDQERFGYEEVVIQAPLARVFEIGGYSLSTDPDLADPDLTDPDLTDPVQVDGWVVLLRDVTEAQNLQQQMQDQSRLAAVGQMAAGIAHDFNNILSVIVLYVQLLQKSRSISAADDRQRLEIIHDQVKHAASLIQQILDFSRRAVLERKEIDLGSLLTEEVALIQRTMPESIQVVCMTDNRPFRVMADDTRLRQIVMNLAVNARDALPNGGVMGFILERVRFDAAHPAPIAGMEDGQWVQLSVKDTGDGISPDHLPHIFEPFFTTKAPGQGTGLGLAQVYGIIKQHGGHITVESQLDQGTVFSIYLPAAKG